MLQKKSSAQETQITRKFRGRRTRGSPVSSVFDLQQEEDKIEIQKLTHLPIQQPNLAHQKPLFRYRHERELPISNHCSTTAPKPLLSLANIARFFNPVHQSSFCTKPMSWFSIRGVGYRFLFNFSHARLLGARFKVLVFISLPSLYLFLSYPHSFFVFYLLSIIAFIITLLISLHLAIPRLPSLRLLLSRSLPHKLNNLTKLPSKASKPVIWSIGSKPEVEKRPNSGTCVQVYSNGDVYEGEIHKGKCSGSGVYYYYMSGRYEGDWVDDKYDGYGVETWARGSRYRGQYRHGLRHGIGVYRFYAGDVYAGEWSNGQCHGSGVHTCEDGSKYVGEFKWGVKHGFGHYHFRNGDTYAGEYFADKMHGFGVYLFGNGHRYEGAWHEGRRQGLGMYTFRNGEAQSGHWHNGVLDALSSGSSPAGSPYAVSHSKVLDAVQEARRSAEKAYSVAKVDDRVNKIVTAANKAANAARVAAVKAVQRQIYHSNSQNSDEAPAFFV